MRGSVLRGRLLELSLADRRSRRRRASGCRGWRCCSGCCIRRPVAAPAASPREASRSRCRPAQVVTGTLAYRDEFTIALTDASGWLPRRGRPTQVKFTVDDPLQAHVEQLGKYTDADMHNVLAYLQTLR